MNGGKGTRGLKLTCIGGGSKNWIPQIMTDLALCDDLTGTVALYDINLEAARQNVVRGDMIFSHPDARTRFIVEPHADIGDALDGADFVVIAIQPGSITMMAGDIDIAKRYGVPHAVGDTAGPAGTVRSLRTIPIYVDFAHQIMDHCPDAWVMNCTNPMAICVSTLYEAEPDIRAFGYCHEVLNTQDHLSEVIEEHFGEKPDDREDVDIEASGVNHFTMATSAGWQGTDLFPILRERMARAGFFADRTEISRDRKLEGQWFTSEFLIAYDFLRRFDVFGAAGDRHLAEFVPWYLSTEDTLHRWGALLTPSSFRLEKAKAEDKPPEPPEKLEPSGGQNLRQLRALMGLKDLETTTNIPNSGQVPGLPLGAVLESNVRFRRDAIEARVVAPLPPAVQALQRRILDVHRATLRAGLEREKDLALRAFLLDPLVHLSPDTAREMLDEMLEATKELLPGWDL